MRITQRDLYASLASHDVRYLVIGGVAAVAYGVNRHTQDIDVIIEATLENAEALLQALREIGMGTAHLIDPQDLLAQEVVIFDEMPRLDVQTRTPGIIFSEAWARRSTGEFEGARIYILSLDDLIASKEAAGRPKDLDDLAILRRIASGELTGDDA